MKSSINHTLLTATLVLATLPCPVSGEENANPIESSESVLSYFEASGYRIEKYSPPPSVVTIHFDQGIGSHSAREKRITKGVLIGKNRVVAPADYFINPLTAPISLPEHAVDTTNNYYCHDQRIKKISHISLPREHRLKPETDENKQRTRPATQNTIRVFNALNFDGTSTIDTLMCHKTENGVINPRPVIAVLSLSKSAARSLPADIPIAEIRERNNDSEEDDTVDSTSMLLRNHFYFHRDSIETKPVRENMNQLIEAARQLPLVEESKGHQKFDAQPSAFISSKGDRHYLHALVNDWELIDEFPSLTNFPDYAHRHPYKSRLWKASSPLAGTISHSLGMTSIPGLSGVAGGILTTVEIAVSASLIQLLANSLLPSIPAYTMMKAGLGLFIVNGLYRWATSEY